MPVHRARPGTGMADRLLKLPRPRMPRTITRYAGSRTRKPGHSRRPPMEDDHAHGAAVAVDTVQEIRFEGAGPES